jgi:predicted CXXCH cytochrome family protein
MENSMNCYRHWLTLAFFLLIPSISLSAATGSFVGSEQCKGCHEKPYDFWKESHHYQAMLPANQDTVLGDFSDRTFEYAGISHRFFRKGDKFFVATDNSQGELQEFEITHTFGFFPLQQYLVPFPDGRYQALNIVWDSRTKDEGGQRWLHLYPDNPVTHEDIVHWTGSFQNWNSRCAACHSTGLEKNYSSTSNSYATTWAEINVACEACHGPASNHIDWAGGSRESNDRGFTFSLNDRGTFGPSDDSSANTWSRLDGQHPTTQVETCAACHARRSEIDPHRAGEPFNNIYRLALIERGLYFPDGQIDDEVYVYGSFLQSKMHQAGVVCSDCHDPHSNALKMEGNALCTQCHNSTVFDQPAHHRHETGSAGAACVSCHMPVKTYMVLDDRHDHGFRIPEPRLTLELGAPNSCNQCHSDKDAQWAINALDAWGISSAVRSKHARVFDSAWSGELSALPGLLALASETATPPIIRASAILATLNYPSQESLNSIQQLLTSDQALLRAAAVRAMDWVPLAQRYALLRDLAEDNSKDVRMAVARQLSGFPAEQLPAASATELTTLFQEYLESMKHNADMPEEQMNLGLYYGANNEPLAAEKAYRTALKLSPRFVPAMLNLADLYRANGMDKNAEPLLQKAIDMAPDEASPLHAMGLLKVRQGKLEDAIPFLRQAAAAGPQNYRYSYVYAVAMWESGSKAEAVAELESALTRLPDNRELLSALASYYQQLGENEKLEKLLQNYAQ